MIAAKSTNLKLLAVALALYIVWVAATWILEGRILLYQNVTPLGRLTYVSIANIAIGTVLAILAIRYLVKAEFVSPKQLGFTNSRRKDIVAIIAASIGGFLLFALQNPRTMEPLVVFNVFMQALPVSIAEVIVCWTLIGSSFESLAKNRRSIASILVGAVAASVLFAVYHYAHSPPFNQTGMVLFLLVPSIATAVTYYITRNVYAAIIVQNFMALYGVLGAMPSLQPYQQPMLPAFGIAAASIAALIISFSVILRKAARRIGEKKKAEAKQESRSESRVSS